MPTGISIHVGLNHLNEAHYKGLHSLSGCLGDAQAMHGLAQAAGFDARLVTGEDATAQAVLDAIEEARPRVGSDGMLLLTYSGHGSRVLDRAEHGRAHDRFDHNDGWDETWCLYDRQLIDDELFACWAGFPEGARILVVSDSCFSGGMVREARPAPGPRLSRRTLWGVPVVPESAQAVESGPAGGTVATAVPVRRRTLRGGAVRGGRQRRRALSSSAYRAVYFRNHALYDEVQREVHSTPPRRVVAEVILLSASGDQQTAADGDTNGAFTAALLEVWNGGAFQGNYLDLHRELRERLVPGQHPQLIALRTPSFLLQRPFTI